MEINVINVNNKMDIKVNVQHDATVNDLKKEVGKVNKKLHPNRQGIRTSRVGRDLAEDILLRNLGIQDGAEIYVRDLGLQVSWQTVFMVEFVGPILIYVVGASRPSFLYGEHTDMHFTRTAKVAMICWIAHFVKRLYETLFVQHYSRRTISIGHMCKDCAFYFGFAAVISEHMNNPHYVPPPERQRIIGLNIFILCELGNLSIHILLRNLRAAGNTMRKIPIPTRNPLTQLFYFVSCPHYTYEFGSWLGFSIMTNCLAAYMFAFVGMYQMTIWALRKHKLYCEEFQDYPKRKAIIPLIL